MNGALLRDKVQGCLVGFYIGDALAMPVHWYYDLRQLVSDYGKSGITKYEAPKVLLKNSLCFECFYIIFEYFIRKRFQGVY